MKVCTEAQACNAAAEHTHAFTHSPALSGPRAGGPPRRSGAESLGRQPVDGQGGCKKDLVVALREHLTVDSTEALEPAIALLRHTVACLARRHDGVASLSAEAGMVGQVGVVLLTCLARGLPADGVRIRDIYDFVQSSVRSRRNRVLYAVTRAVRDLESSTDSDTAIDVIWNRLRDDLVELDEAFASMDAEAMMVVLMKTRAQTMGPGKYSLAKAAAALSLNAGALGARRRQSETIHAARTRIAKSFRLAAK